MTVPFHRVRALVAELSGLDPARRRERLDAACEGQPELRAEVESLLAHADAPDSFLDRPLQVRASSGATERPAAGATDPRRMAIPERVGQYRIVRRIAAGGMGTVYLAEQEHPRRVVALKTIRHHFVSERLRQRFRRESELLGRLQHRGIAQIFEAGVFDRGEGQEPFFALEFVEGVPLTEYARSRRLSVAARVELVIEVCDAVEHAHQRGVVHRDLKPDNILVDASGQPKILDFGVACSVDADAPGTTLQTAPGQLIGTIAYMSPEQVGGDPDSIDARSDVYALGVLLFEVLGDRLPLAVHGQSLPAAARVIREDTPIPLGSVDTALRGDLETIAGKALEKDPGRRYASARALGDDLRRHLVHAPISARPPSASYRLRKFAQRHKALVLGAATTLVVSVVGAVVASVFAVRAARNEVNAVRALGIARVAIADRALAEEPRVARRALDEVPEVLRNWEWYHLDSRLAPLGRIVAPTRGRAEAGHGSVAIAADGTALFAIVDGARVVVSDLATGDIHTTIEAPVALQSVRLAGDGSRLVAIGADGARVLVFAVSDGRQVLDSGGHTGLAQPAISADGARIAMQVAREEGATEVEVLDARTGDLILAPRMPSRVTPEYLSPVLSADGSLVAVHRDFAGDGGSFVTVFDCATGAVRGPDRHVGFTAAAFSRRGDQIAVGTGGQAVVRFTTDTGDRLSKWQGTERVRAFAFDRDDTCVATASSREARVLDLTTGESIAAISVGADEIALSADGSRLAAANADGGWLWDLGAGRAMTLRDDGVRKLALAFHPDGSLLACLSWNGIVRVWDTRSGEMLVATQANPDALPGQRAGNGVQFTADGAELFVSGGDHRTFDLAAQDGFGPSSTGGDGGQAWIEYWRRCGGQGERGAAVARRWVLWKPDAEALVCIDARTGKPMASPVTFPGGPTATAVAVSPDGRLVASGHVGGVIRLWNSETGVELRQVAAHDDRVYSLDFSPDGTRLVSGGLDFSVRVFDVATLEQVLELRGHEDSLRDVAFSPDGTQIASCGSDGTVRLWDSVPASRRVAQARAAAALQARLQPRVDALRAEAGDRAAAAARIRADASLDARERTAALRILMARTRDVAPEPKGSGR